MSVHSHRIRAALLGAWLATSGAAYASASCSIRGVTGINFGQYDPTRPNGLLTAGSITLCCDELGATDYLSVDLSSGSTNRTSERAMLGGADKLIYNLYMDRALIQLWGDGFDGTAHYGPLRPPSGECSSIPVYGYMPPHQAVRAGNYSDTLTVTLSF